MEDWELGELNLLAAGDQMAESKGVNLCLKASSMSEAVLLGH